MKFSIYVIWFFLLSITNVSAEKTPEELSSTCLGCHGVVSYNNIYPTYKVPKLGNQHKDYLVAALKAYRSGERTHLTMRAHASNLSDSDIVKVELGIELKAKHIYKLIQTGSNSAKTTFTITSLKSNKKLPKNTFVLNKESYLKKNYSID